MPAENIDLSYAENHELKLAFDFIQYTNSNIFLTGKAGTGKTTFLHNLHKTTTKRMIVTAPTGVAAINAGGVTLHSFFQLSFGPFVPDQESYESKRNRMFRFAKDKKQIIQSLDLLVIDEISMVRSDLLDAVDAVLRRLRHNDKPFGGVQLLMIGDLYQLPPVAKQNEWDILQEFYDSIYFFSSHSLVRTQLFTIELKHIYRQSEIKFIKLLNSVRNNQLDENLFKELNKRYIPDFNPDENQGYITLTTHNKRAEFINNSKLEALSEKPYNFNAHIFDDFPEHIYPTSASLVLKKGAQVMFIRNDASSDKLYYNGKIGRISRISDNGVYVVCPDENFEIEVEPIVWENIKYAVNPETKEIQEEIIGSFEQYPLKLAWAITIHKSQGLTFEKAVIDAKAAFASGQIYVALSRCKTFKGMVLSSLIPSHSIKISEAIIKFSKAIAYNPLSEKQLYQAKIIYQQQLLLECFDFKTLQSHFSYFLYLLRNNEGLIQISGIKNINYMQTIAFEKIFSVSKNFKIQLKQAFDSNNMPETNDYIQKRVSKASKWFQDNFAIAFEPLTQNFNFETDNTEIRKKINNVLSNLVKEINVKLEGIKTCEKKFSVLKYLQVVAHAQIDFTPKKIKKVSAPDYQESDIQYPELFNILGDWRSHTAKKTNVARFQVMHQKTLIQIAMNMPDNLADLKI